MPVFVSRWSNVLRRAPIRLATIATIGLLAATHLPAAAHAIEIVHAKGRLDLPGVPKKVVVFDPASLDVLDSLGVPVAGVARGPKPDYLEKYDGAPYAKIGTMFEPDYEAVNALAPDLIIVGLRSSPKYDALSKIAPTIDMTVDSTDLLSSSRQRIHSLARLFGKEAEAAARLSKIEAGVEAIRAKAGKAGTGLIVLTTGGRLSAFASGSRFGVIHDSFGVRPAAPEIRVGLHGQPISFEFIRKVNPDWLFVLDRDAAIDTRGQPARQLLDNDLVRQTNAWRKGQIVYLDSASFYLVNGGLTSMQRIVDQIGNALDAAK